LCRRYRLTGERKETVMRLGRWEMFAREIEGFELMAPLSFWDATQEEIEEKTGGCGPGKIGDWFVPDTMYGESVFLACQIHDWMYGEGTTAEDKKWADVVFLVNMTLLIIDDKKEILDVARLRRVMTYFEAVYYTGFGAFNKGETPQKSIIGIFDDEHDYMGN